MKRIINILDGIDKGTKKVGNFFWTLALFIGFPLVTGLVFIGGWDFMKDGEVLTGIGILVFGFFMAIFTIGGIWVTISDWIAKAKQKERQDSR